MKMGGALGFRHGSQAQVQMIAATSRHLTHEGQGFEPEFLVRCLILTL